MSSYIDTDHTNLQHGSVELLRLYFGTDVDPSLFLKAEVAFTRGYDTPLPDEPEWTEVEIADDHLRVVFGRDVFLERGVWTVYAKVSSDTKAPIESIPGYLRVL